MPTAAMAESVDVPQSKKQQRRGPEPIAYIGHGAFFDGRGQQIVPTEDFVRRAQDWYRAELAAALLPEQAWAFASFRSSLVEGLGSEGQSRLLLEQRSLAWLLQRVPRTEENRLMLGKITALEHRLQWRLAPSDDPRHLLELKPFAPDIATSARLAEIDTELEMSASFLTRVGRAESGMAGGERLEGGVDALVTVNDGQAYINECVANSVPIPPPIGVLDANGTAGWKSQGFIPQAEQFIVGTPAEVRTFESPDGMCIALPRYLDATLAEVVLDGIICQSSVTSKVCFWDNQMNGAGFVFPAGDKIPIGLPDLGIDPAGRYQAGGAELEFGSGGPCSNCHAGENAYIIHPDADLGGGLLFGNLDAPPNNLPTFAPNRYDPIVAASWPQNQLSQAQHLVPPICSGCHSAGGGAGRFPHLSSDLAAYCGAVLTDAIDRSMPPWSPGSEAGTQAMNDFLAWCSLAPTAGPSNRGDPHLRTVNGVAYDFQSAGEFVSLRDSNSGFELQTRQTPVRTTFTPGPNAHTGLASCVSLNTAAAVRLGPHQVSVQPSVESSCDEEKILLYIDGEPVWVPPGGIDLGDGNRIARIPNKAGYELRASDGTRVLITEHFWASEGYSYLNIEVLDTPAREGTMGAIIGNDWLPRAPDGSSFGPRPAAIPDRDLLLNMTFADAWRVEKEESLFVYAPGTSTHSFTDPSWPPPSGTPCDAWPVPPREGCDPRDPVDPIDREEAKEICIRFLDGPFEPGIFEECVFDVEATGNPGMADALELSLAVREAPCNTCDP